MHIYAYNTDFLEYQHSIHAAAYMQHTHMQHTDATHTTEFMQLHTCNMHTCNIHTCNIHTCNTQIPPPIHTHRYTQAYTNTQTVELVE